MIRDEHSTINMRPTIAGYVFDVAVDVRVGDAYETVTVHASWTHPEGDADARPPTVTATRTEDGDVAIVVSGGAGGRARVACRIPPRFCGVDVASGGGDVHVESVVEATVRVSSDGGAVTFGSVKGAAARVDTDGGKLFAKNVTADAARSSRQATRRFHRMAPEARVVLTGWKP